MRKLKQAEDNDKKQAAKNSSNRADVCFLQQPFTITFTEPVAVEELSSNFPTFDYQYISRYLTSIFQATQVCSLIQIPETSIRKI